MLEDWANVTAEELDRVRVQLTALLERAIPEISHHTRSTKELLLRTAFALALPDKPAHIIPPNVSIIPNNRHPSKVLLLGQVFFISSSSGSGTIARIGISFEIDREAVDVLDIEIPKNARRVPSKPIETLLAPESCDGFTQAQQRHCKFTVPAIYRRFTASSTRSDESNAHVNTDRIPCEMPIISPCY